MALGTRLTLLDYLGTQNSTKNRATEQALSKGKDLNIHIKFNQILSTCLREKNSAGLTAADYLENPIKAQSKTYLTLKTPETGIRTKLGDPRPYQTQSKTAKADSLIPDQIKTEGCMSPYSIYEDIERSIKKAAKQYDLPHDLIKGVIRAESDFQVRAESSSGALGLMQLMPATARELGVQDPFDIDQNIDAGTRYLKKMMVRYGGDTKKALAAYNAGPGTVDRYGGHVPYKETRQYVKRVLAFSGLTT